MQRPRPSTRPGRSPAAPDVREICSHGIPHFTSARPATANERFPWEFQPGWAELIWLNTPPAARNQSPFQLTAAPDCLPAPKR